MSWDIDRRHKPFAGRASPGAWRRCGLDVRGGRERRLALMMPLKTVEPYVIRVDNSTGIVDIVPMYAGHAEMGEAVARFLLTHYITVCEGFSYATARARLRGMRRLPQREAQYRVVQPLESSQSRLALERQQRRLDRARASHGGDLLSQGQWPLGISAGSLLEGARAPRRCRENHPLDRDHRVRVGHPVQGSEDRANGTPWGGASPIFTPSPKALPTPPRWRPLTLEEDSHESQLSCVAALVHARHDGGEPSSRARPNATAVRTTDRSSHPIDALRAGSSRAASRLGGLSRGFGV